jgi:ribonuclease J
VVEDHKHSGRSETLPEIVSRGFVSFEQEGSGLLHWGVMKEKIRADLKRFLNKQTSRRPLITPVILEV